MREPPKISSGHVPIRLYVLFRRTGTKGGTCVIETATRVRLGLEGRTGEYVRYGTHYHQLHPASDLHNVLSLEKQSGLLLGNVEKGRYFGLSEDEPLPFIALWEQPVGLVRTVRE